MNKFVLAAALSSGVMAAAALASAPAFAQDALAGMHAYGNLGYNRLDTNSVGLNAVDARLGARLGSYFGIEGEGAFGVGHDSNTFGAVNTQTKLAHSFAGYAVGFFPVTPRFDVLARVGYGNTHFTQTVTGVQNTLSADSVNYGAGAQYFFTGADGVRAEYTRNDYRHSLGHANVWGVSYVRKF